MINDHIHNNTDVHKEDLENCQDDIIWLPKDSAELK